MQVVLATTVYVLMRAITRLPKSAALGLSDNNDRESHSLILLPSIIATMRSIACRIIHPHIGCL